MSPTRRTIGRSTRRNPKSDVPPALRRGRENRGVRWIGAAKRRTKKLVAVAGSAPMRAQIIRLSCADTFSRPVRSGAAGTFTQVLPFQARALRSERQGAPRCAADQPSVPVLR
jgi:hypothetical protein